VNISESTKANGIPFLVALALMSAAGLVGSDIYLPSFPALGEYFHVSDSAIQSTLSVYLLVVACGQLVYGPLSQAFGRRRLLLFGSLVYFLSSVLCAFSWNYPVFMIARIGQGAGVATGLVVGRALIGDLFDKQHAGKVFSTIFPFVGMSPAIAPAIGGVLASEWGWRACFAFLSLFAGILFILVFVVVPETLSERNRHPLHPGIVLRHYIKALFFRELWIYAMAPCVAYMTYFAYIAQSPFIFEAHGFAERTMGLLYITLSLTYVLGNFFGKMLITRNVKLDRILSLSYSLFFIGGLLFWINGIWEANISLMILFISILTFANGQLIPLGTAGVVSALPQASGYASALLGFLQFLVTSLVVTFINDATSNNIARLGVFIVSVTLVATCLWFARTLKT